MSQSIRSWLREQNRITKNMSIEELSSSYCFRDPLRPIKNNHEVIYSPSDGIIVDYSSVTNLEDCIYGKYGNVSLNKLSYGMIPKGEYDVVSIFLTFYDAHIVRMPINGIVKRVDLPPYFVEDRSMLDIEKNIMSSKYSSVRKELITCFAFNERVLYSIKSPLKKEEMFLILTADYDIDTILSFASREQPLKQNQRLASIRYGSMVTCIIPKRWHCEFVCKENIHIEAGVDALFMYE